MGTAPRMKGVSMQVGLTIRDFDVQDLSDLEWSGGSEHLTAVAEALQASYADQVDLEVIALPNGRLIALGGVDYRKTPGSGELWMLSVHETFQGIGVGSALVGALEDRVRARGLAAARLRVEHDNPRAAALYRRLGYREIGSALDSWGVAGGQTYVTVCTVMEHDLALAAH